ncbi:hypothetical protein [Streptomyces avermitilis]|uniref:hypothetical protein n=1 Tax=Streptomyces avermitilis TaxID=33903 RepID=UPI0037F2C082
MGAPGTRRFIEATAATEWDAHIAEHGNVTPDEARRDDEVTRLRRKLAEKTRECTLLHQRLDAAATAIAALHHDNTQLREELTAVGGRVTPLWTTSTSRN